MRCLPIFALISSSGSVSAEPDFSEVGSYLAKSVADGEVAGGAVIVLQRGETVFETGFGFADLETKRPFEVATPAVIASISKPVLGTAVFRLAEAGRLDVDVPISRYLPEFSELKTESGQTLGRAPTVAELLTHTSGLRESEATGGRPWYAAWTKGQPLSHVVRKYAREFPLEAPPGSRYAYSGIGTDVVARVAEVAAERPRNELLLEQVCRPLGMGHTFYRDSERIRDVGPMPTRYHHGKDGKLLVSRKREQPAPLTYSSSGGSIVSTAPDLARWLLMIRNGGVHGGEAFLKPAMVEDMLTANNLGKNARAGFFVRGKNAAGEATVIGHSGSSGTDCWIDFRNDLIGILITQTRGEDIDDFRSELRKRIRAVVPPPKG